MTRGGGRVWLCTGLLALGCGGGAADTPDAGPAPAAETPACDTPEAGGFCDATAAAGIDVAQMTYISDPIVGGVAVLDADGDGRLDLFFPGFSTASRLYRNLGGLRFADATADAGLAGLSEAAGAAVADYDNDGDPDLVVLRYGAGALLYANDGAGHFSDVTEAAGLAGASPPDTYPTPISAAFDDVNRDGLLDLYVGHWATNTTGQTTPNQLFLGQVGGTFVEVAASAGAALSDKDFTLAVSFADFDDDGDDDLFVINDFGPYAGAACRLLVNDTPAGGAPSFRDDGAAHGFDLRIFGMSATPLDFDEDGDLDLYVANFGRNVLLRNDAAMFTDVAGEVGTEIYGYADPAIPVEPFGDSPAGFADTAHQFADRYLDQAAGLHVDTTWGTVGFDYDNDGDLDLFAANGFVGFGCWSEGRRQPDTLLRNDGGQFSDVTAAMGIVNQQDGGGVAVGDLDGDGDLDLAMGSQGRGVEAQRPVILRNDVATAPAVVVRLRGVASNRDGIGARLVAEIGSRQLHRYLSGGDGVASASPHQVWFGLGDAAQIDRLTVRWPSGTVDVLTGVTAGSIEIAEGSSP